MKKPQLILIPIALVMLLLVGVFYVSGFFLSIKLPITIVCLAVSALVILIAWISLSSYDNKKQKEMDAVFSDNQDVVSGIISGISVPCLVCDTAGKITWRNDSMEQICADSSLKNIQPSYNFTNPPANFRLEYNNNVYQVMSMQLVRPSADKILTFQYWIDRTEVSHYQRLYEENRPLVALIYVDNFDELSSDQQFQRTAVLTEVERLVASTVQSINGIYREYENGRFLVVFESSHLKELEESKFALLESARHIETGTSGIVTLSVSVGVADRIAASDDSAKQALELALGRGGDQAVIKSGTNYTFYGGKHQLDSRQSRVKARLFAKALRQMFENGNDVFVMGHTNCDMDSLGSGLGIMACAKLTGSRTYFVLDAPNDTISIALDTIRNTPAYSESIITPEQADALWKPSSILVVVDTQRLTTTCSPSLVEKASRLVLIDHHRRSADHIDNSTLNLLESRASSAAELVTEVIQYFDDSPRVPSFICSALLAGITVDTKHFAFNVGSRTFEAAGYLRKNGADISMVKQMFQDDIGSYLACADAVRQAEIIGGKVAITKCVPMDNCDETEKLLSAKIADQLINIKGIEAGFALGHDGDVISVSGRSLGLVNAQLICERLGGGGHLTMAGAQLPNMTIDEAYDLCKAKIDEYLKEVKIR